MSDDESTEEIVSAFGRGKKYMTVQTYEYKHQEEPVQAMQWLKTNVDVVLDWLTILDVQYTYHEISSQNKLYVYTNGPMQVEFCDWIVRPGPTNDVIIYTEKSFAETFQESSAGDR